MKAPRPSKRRHLRTRVIKKIEEIPAEEFNKIFPDVPERYHFFKTLDESNFDQFSFYYILVYANKHLVGVAPCFTTHYRPLFNMKILVCGLPMGQGQIGIVQSYSAVLEAIEERMEMVARKVEAPLIAFKDLDQSYDDLFRPLLKNDYVKIDGLPMTRLSLDFADFEDYLKTLSRATRYDLRRKLKKASTINIESSVVNALDETTLNEVYTLYLQTVEMHDIRSKIVPKEFFRSISTNMPQETKFFLFRINGQLAAFVFCLVSKRILLDYYVGFDYTLAHEYHLYFVKFKKIMDWCIGHKIKTYEMGAAGYEPKRRLNFKLIPVYLYVKSRSKPLRPFLRIYSLFLKCWNFTQQAP